MTEPPTWPDAVELRPAKIAALRVLALQREERERLLDLFMQHRGEDRMPTAPLINTRDQRHLQTLYEIDLERIRSLLILIGRADMASHIRIPISAVDQAAFTNKEWEVARQAVSYELRDASSRQEIVESLGQIYRYLSGADNRTPLRRFDGDAVDIVIVPGCRGNGMKFRVQCALDVLGRSPTPSRLFLSGWHPYYARQFDFDSAVSFDGNVPIPLPFGEADAMAAVIGELEPTRLTAPYLIDGQSRPTEVPLRQVLVDSRARNTLETVVHSLPIIHETFAALGRRLKICLVTSPYHVRRFHAITTVQLGHLLPFPETVESIVCAPARSGLDLQQLVSSDHARHTDAVALYVRECFKLLGGRATGEF